MILFSITIPNILFRLNIPNDSTKAINLYISIFCPKYSSNFSFLTLHINSLSKIWHWSITIAFNPCPTKINLSLLYFSILNLSSYTSFSSSILINCVSEYKNGIYLSNCSTLHWVKYEIIIIV